MALNHIEIQEFVDSLSGGIVRVTIGSRNESAWEQVATNRLFLALAAGKAPNTPTEMRTIGGELINILLPEPEQLTLGSQAQDVNLAGPDGAELVVAIEYVELSHQGVRTTVDLLSGKGSPHKRVQRTKKELEESILHCLRCLVQERLNAVVTTKNPELSEEEVQQLSSTATASGLPKSKIDEIISSHKERKAAKGK